MKKTSAVPTPRAKWKQEDLTGVSDIGITNHALGKLRERLPSHSPWVAVGDGEVRDMLISEWNRARLAQEVELWWEDIEGVARLNHVFDLRDEGLLGAPLVALVREDDRTPGRAVYVSVLTASMAERSRKLGHWAATKAGVGRRASGPIPSFNNTALRDKLVGVAAAPAMKPTSALDHLLQKGQVAAAAPVQTPAERLRAWLTRERIRVTDAAKQMGIPQPALSNILRRGSAGADMRERISKLTNNEIPAESWGPETKMGRPVGAKSKWPSEPQPDALPSAREVASVAQRYDMGFPQAPGGSIFNRLEHLLRVVEERKHNYVPVPVPEMRALLNLVRAAASPSEDAAQALQVVMETAEQRKMREQEAFQRTLDTFKKATPEQKMQQVLDKLAARGESVEDFWKRLVAPVETT